MQKRLPDGRITPRPKIGTRDNPTTLGKIHYLVQDLERKARGETEKPKKTDHRYALCT